MRFWEPLLRPEFHPENSTARETAAAYLAKFGLAIRSDDDWRDWSRNVGTLHEAHSAKESGIARVPGQDHVDRVLSGVRLWIMPEKFPTATVQYQLTREPETPADLNATGQIDNLRVFWQAVWLSFFDSRVFSAFPSICWGCFELLPATPKTGKLSRQKLCAKCRKRESRRLNAEAARAATRRWKKRNRAEAARRRRKKKASGN